MTAARPYAALRAFCDELARCGLTDACTSPGSRSTPLVLPLVREPRIRCWSHLDERCAGFFALGLAKASGRPVAVACTSGTAAAELAPAVIEAHEARVPLVVLTADRPPELRDVGAGQTIDQLKLYGSASKWFCEVGTLEGTPWAWVRALACRAYWTAQDGRPGPVHLNFPLREPLLPQGEAPEPAPGRPGARPWVERVAALPSAEASAVTSTLSGRPRGVLVAGRSERDGDLPGVLAAFAGRAGYPVLADPLSGSRHGGAAIAHYDLLLRDEGWATAHRPEVVIRTGDLPTSKPLRSWLAGLVEVEQILLDPEGAWQDPAAAGSTIVRGDPATALAGADPAQADPAWLDSWRKADARAARAVRTALGDGLSEPVVAAELGARLPAEATLVVASSMPVRDVESFFPVRDGPRVLANRGANGIDGTVSTAFGAAAGSAGPTVLLVGDVALAYDVGGLLAARRLGLRLTIVVLNNDGGGIFSFLPVAGEADVFEEHVATPHGLDFAAAAALYGCGHERPADLAGFRRTLDAAVRSEGTTLIEVRTERVENRELHRRTTEAVIAALA